mgnify:FL=1
MTLKHEFNWAEDPIFLFDGSSFIYRAFYAYPDLYRSDGFPTNALYIVLRLLLKIIREQSPRYCCFLLDGKGPTFRNELLDSYKAQRQKMPEPLSQQIPHLLEGARLLGLKTLVGEDGEADDYIATLSARHKSSSPVVIVGSDKDLQQCLDTNVILWDPGQRTEKIVTLESFQDQNGLTPAQWPDFQALTGDKSDNIPGVPGIGPKTALKILKRFPSIESLVDNVGHLGRKEQEKLRPHLEDLPLYKKLTTLKTDLETVSSLPELACAPPARDDLLSFFQTFEFTSLIKDLDSALGEGLDKPSQGSAAPDRAQPSSTSLPTLNGKRVGLIETDQEGFLVGLDDDEYRVACSHHRLRDIASAAELCYVPSLKSLYHADPAWLEVPLELIFDLSLAAYLLNPEDRDYSWKRLEKGFLEEIDTHKDNQGLAVLRIGELLRTRLEQSSLLDLMFHVEMPLIPTLFKMERRGVCIDLEAFSHFLSEVEERLNALTRTIFEQAGCEFNLRSTQQLAEVLFDRLGLKPGRKTPGGHPSTEVSVLEGIQHQHPIIANIVEFRSLEKLRSTYLDPLPRLVDQDSRLHTTFNNLATATGRLSSSKPNLQNIPVRGDFGPRMRACFIAPPGSSLIAADYSQIELRVLAHMSEDPNLLEAFANREDIHTRTASLLFDQPREEITVEQRRKAKTINFGLLYGMGPQKLARELSIPMNEAKSFISIYFERLESVRRFYEQVEAGARDFGYVTTLAGRRRLLKNINSGNENLAGQARRMAINTVIQGSAADIIKLAMNQVDRDQGLRDAGAELILQIHDELLLEAPHEAALQAGQRVASIMTSVMELNVPLVVDWGTGSNWKEAH